MEFEVNSYNPCVANMMVDGGQITVCWHVDDLNISHRDEAIVSEFAMALAKEFGPKTTISRGKMHDYLGMDLDFGTCPGTMIISMIKYLQKVIGEFLEVPMGYQGMPRGGQFIQGMRR